MPVFRLAIPLFLLCGPIAHANWETDVAPDDSPYAPGRASIQYNPYNGDIPTFREALAHLRETGHLDRLEMITIHGATIEPQFQHELIEALEAHVPEEFAEARASSGNMHNPALRALNDVIDDVVLRMPTVQQMDAELKGAGRQISRVSHEKLALFDRDGELFVMIMLWLSVEGI